MKKLGYVIASASMAMALSTTTFADEPTRGFLIESGKTAVDKSASVDLGVQGGYTSGALRLGLDFGEVILTTEKSDNRGYSAGIVKIDLPALEGLSELKHTWAAYGGVSALSLKSDNPNLRDASHVNLIAGVAFTAQIEQLEVTVNPELIINTNNQKDTKYTGYQDKSDTYVNLNLGAYYNMADTKYGVFKPGAEMLISSQSGAKTGLALGVRWAFNERINLDVLPIYVNNSRNNDVFSLPGQIRLNASF